MAKSNPYGKSRRTFGILFVISTGVFLLLLLVGFLLVFRAEGSVQPGTVPDSNDQIVIIGGIVGIFTSCLTSLIAFIGFISTLVLGWRKEARDTKTSDLERKKLEIELEKQKLELNKLKTDEKKTPESEGKAGKP
jgi:hypothetical protein